MKTLYRQIHFAKRRCPSYSLTQQPTVSNAVRLSHKSSFSLPDLVVLLSCAIAGFEINEETREFLKTLSGPIGVLSVAGMYRSGKSYLLNRVLLNRSRGFDVGHTINACTKVSRTKIICQVEARRLVFAGGRCFFIRTYMNTSEIFQMIRGVMPH